jgi:copper chaperone CopZ
MTMKPLMMMLAFLFLGSMSVQAQSAKACCSGKEKTSCTKAEKASCDKTASAAKACCAKGEQGKSCAKSAGSAAKKVSNDANVSTASIRIYGNCGMCKRTIEGALNEVEGIHSAEWDVKSGMLSVAYEAEKVSEDDIKAKVAAAGYDSDTHRAPDEVYANLHACCQYDRPKG